MTECSVCLDEINELKAIHGCKQSELHTFHLECIQSLVENNFKKNFPNINNFAKIVDIPFKVTFHYV
mgnify:CR=1 FL=1